MKTQANLFQILVGLFKAHVDDCRECQQAKFSGDFCMEGHKHMTELNSFFLAIEPKVLAA